MQIGFAAQTWSWSWSWSAPWSLSRAWPW